MGTLPANKATWGVADIAGYMGVSKSAVHRFIREERLACYDIGGKFIAHREDVEQLLQELRIPRREPVVRMQE
jgi:excisionase family DNA binding protein